jgi:2-oxoisovalerate dehydrogenase E1 component
MKESSMPVKTEGKANQSLGGSNFLLEALGKVAFIRAFESEALALTQAKPPVIQGSVHLCAGQEAVPVGAMAALRDDDQVVCTYRGHGWALASGVDGYAAMAELCHRVDGVNGGRGGSAYMMAPHTRFIGENSIVGAGTTIACGVALANLAAKNERVVIVTIGDGAMNQGAVHEAMAFAAARSLPVIFVVENNGWSELTATSDMFKVDRLAQRAKGYGIPSATVSGVDPVAIRDSIAAAAAHARSGMGPSLIEFKAPRLWGHYNRDIEHYRSKADRAAAEANDPIGRISEKLLEAGVDQAAIDSVIAEEAARAKAIAEAAAACAEPDPSSARDHVIGEVIARNPRILDTKEMTYIEAVNTALRTELQADENVLFFGEDVGKSGGIFAAARNLQREFGADRVFDTPIAENAILGSAVGAAVSGLRPVAEIMWADFVFVAIDQIVNQAANIRYLTSGRSHAPLTVRMQQGVTPGSCAQHSQSIEALFAHMPGLHIGVPSNANDAYAMLRAAIRNDDPCIVIEARSLYQIKSEVELTDEAESVGGAKRVRDGRDVAIISWGTMVPRALEAADLLAQQGVDAAVLDLRWIAPLDFDAVTSLVEQCGGKAIIVHEAVQTGGFGAELGMRIVEHFAQQGKAVSVERVTTPDVRMPASPVLQAALLPNASAIAARVQKMVG